VRPDIKVESVEAFEEMRLHLLLYLYEDVEAHHTFLEYGGGETSGVGAFPAMGSGAFPLLGFGSSAYQNLTAEVPLLRSE
jgi:hypothetical protein